MDVGILLRRGIGDTLNAPPLQLQAYCDADCLTGLVTQMIENRQQDLLFSLMMLQSLGVA
jgi:hypothetical protein